ncbi:MAG: hypothetical protein M3R36_09960 [Bacteroidota bacterium]|nr:hypothetical protein [Bacteroidota bacterium]
MSVYKYFAIIIFVSENVFAQSSHVNDKINIYQTGADIEVNVNNNTERFEKIKTGFSKGDVRKKQVNVENIIFRFANTKKEEKYSFDIISSVGSNISFGGFWDKYALLNFTPQMYIKPLSFISIYANNNLYCLIPLKGIKEHFQSVTIQGLSILAIDNSMKLFFPDNHWIPQLISFAAKNLLINFVIKPSFKKSNNSDTQILDFENYYYSVSINF